MITIISRTIDFVRKTQESIHIKYERYMGFLENLYIPLTLSPISSGEEKLIMLIASNICAKIYKSTPKKVKTEKSK